MRRAFDGIGSGGVLAQKSRGTLNSPKAVLANDHLFSFGAGGYDGSDWRTNSAIMFFDAETNWSGSDRSSAITFETTAAGGTTRTEKLRITSSGNVGIGTTRPSYRLHVDGDIAYTGNIYDVSDLRLKENINPIENAVEKIFSINGIYFNYKGESVEKREVGVIAQDVEKVLPEVVSEDADGYKSVDYSKLTPLLIEAVKELKAENESLKTQNYNLKQEIEQIKKAIGL